jgi:hypothetical protein
MVWSPLLETNNSWLGALRAIRSRPEHVPVKPPPPVANGDPGTAESAPLEETENAEMEFVTSWLFT